MRSNPRIYTALFDSFYLSRGLALWQSLSEYDPNCRLYVFAFDALTEKALKAQQDPRLIVVPLKDFETQELLEVKASRTKAEYCWTCTPWILRHVLEKFGEPHCIYVDADIRLYSSPQPLFDELAEKSILLTEHRFSADFNRLSEAGRYCVQFMYFRNDESGRRALNWWSERCLEWCFDRYEDGKFGDQKYLDDWTERFPGVHVLQHVGGGVAPWNVARYEFKTSPAGLQLRETPDKALFPVVFYHFHGLRFYPDEKIQLGHFRLPTAAVEHIYRPYVGQLSRIEKELQAKWSKEGYRTPISPPRTGFRALLGRVKRRWLGKDHVFTLSEFAGGPNA
jgi:hypothetical protein